MGEAKYYLSREHVEAMRAPFSEQINFSHPVLVYFKGTVHHQWNINGMLHAHFPSYTELHEKINVDVSVQKKMGDKYGQLWSCRKADFFTSNGQN